MLIETMQSHGVDSFPALLAATVQGSTETTFYVLATEAWASPPLAVANSLSN